MKVNILELIVLAVTALFALWGYRRGFIKKLASMLSLILSVVLISYIFPYMADFLQNSTPLYGYITRQCESIVTEKATESFLKKTEETDQMEDAGEAPDVSEQLSLDGLGRIEQSELIQRLPIPTLLKNLIEDNNNKEGYRGLNADGFKDYLVHFVAKIIMNVITFIVAVIVVQLIIWAMIATLNVISHIPLIHIVNKFAGLLLGLLQALFFLWLFFLILPMFGQTGVGAQLVGMIESSKILTFAYEQNLFMKVIIQTAALFA